MGEYIKIRIPKNPWIISTLILSIILIAILVFYIFFFNGKSSSLDSVPSNQVGQKVVDFLNTQVNGTVQLQNVSDFSGIYEVDVLYKGQTLPVYSTKDGNYLIQSVIPIN